MKKIALLLSLCLLAIPASIFAKVSVTVTELTDAPGVYKMTFSSDQVYDAPLPPDRIKYATEYSLFIEGDTYVNGEKYMENYASQFYRLVPDFNDNGGIIIPSSYKTSEGEVAIKKIGDNAFKELKRNNNYSCLEFTISEGIEEIGTAAFMDTYIGDIKLPASLKKIGDDAFHASVYSGTWDIILPSSDITIGERAFAGYRPNHIRFGASSADGISASFFEDLYHDDKESDSNYWLYYNIVVPSSAVESFAAKFPSLKDKYLFACDFPFEDIYVGKDNVASDPDATFIAYVKPYDEATLSELYESHTNVVEYSYHDPETGWGCAKGSYKGQWYEGCEIYSEASQENDGLYCNTNGFQDLGESKYQLTATDLGSLDFQCAMVLAYGSTDYETDGYSGVFDEWWNGIKPKHAKYDYHYDSRYEKTGFHLHELAHIQVHIVDMTAETDIYLPKNQVQAAEEQVTVLWDNMPYGAGVRYEIVSQNAPQNAEVNAMPSNNPVYVNLLDAADGTIQAAADAPVGSTAVLKATLIAPTGKELVSRNITIHVTDVVNGGEGMPGDTTGIETIEADENGEAVYYNLNGMQISSDSLTPGLYIRRAGNKTEKVFVK